MKYSFLLGLITTIGFLQAITPSASNPIAPDNSLSTQVEQTGNQYKITGGANAGNNLFHSFREFSIPEGATAIFDHNGNIINIFTRVTGSSISNIEGTLQAHGIANFFLINPNGIIFGPNAQLDVSGSFVASTASSIKFADGTEFSSINPSLSPVLTVSVPIGLQFGDNSGSIINRSVSVARVNNPDPNTATKMPLVNVPVGLRVKPGNTLALVGGGINLEGGNLTATGGRVELGSVADNSFVNLNPNPQGWQLSYEQVKGFENIQLSNGSTVDVSEADGTAKLQGRIITLSSGGQIRINTTGDQSAGQLIINTSEALELLGTTPQQDSSLSAGVERKATGNGANISINTNRLTIKDGASIGLSTVGQGQGGQLIINATKLVEIEGTGFFPSIITSSTGGEANAGLITINTERLVVANGGRILALTASGTGNGGVITINASQSLEITGAGTITNSSRIIETPSLISTTSGFEDLDFPGIGTGGNLNINTGQLIVSNGGQINVGSFRGGQAGNLTINARSVSLNQGQILAESTSGTGGNIFITASGLLTLRNNSLISATAGTQQTGGNGGNITITAPFIVAVPNEDSDITANAFSGTGGNVTINETAVFGIERRNRDTPLSDITASSEFGRSGNITFSRPEVDPQTGIVTLPSEVLDAENTVVQSCGTGGTLAGGEFIVTGRGGTPADPYELPDLNTELNDLGQSQDSSSGTASDLRPSPDAKINPPESIIEAQGWIKDTQGNVILTAQSSNVTPSSSGLSSTHCQNRSQETGDRSQESGGRR